MLARASLCHFQLKAPLLTSVSGATSGSRCFDIVSHRRSCFNRQARPGCGTRLGSTHTNFKKPSAPHGHAAVSSTIGLVDLCCDYFRYCREFPSYAHRCISCARRPTHVHLHTRFSRRAYAHACARTRTHTCSDTCPGARNQTVRQKLGTCALGIHARTHTLMSSWVSCIYPRWAEPSCTHTHTCTCHVRA